jgi:capsular polysaccharide biosynthesis protein
MVNVRQAGRLARRWGGWLVLGALAGALAFFVVSLRHPPVYRAEATVAVVSAVTGNEADLYDVDLASALVPTYRLTIQSHAVLSDVIGTLRLPTTPAALESQISVVAVPGTNLLTIQVYYENSGDMAARVANTVAEQFIRRATLDRAAPFAAQRAALTARQTANEAALQAALTRQATLRAVPTRSAAEEQELAELDAAIAGYLLTRSTLRQQVDALGQIQAFNAGPARLVEQAVPPEPIAVRGIGSLGIAALTGGVAAALILWALAFAPGPLREAQEVRAVLRLPLLGVIPRDE